MEDKKISEAAKALVRGAKMLSQHCPECKLPLFQEGERVYCPSCGRDVVIVSDAEDVSDISNKVEVPMTISKNAERNLERLIDELSAKLLESSYSEMREILDIMLKTVEILNKLKK